jgi:exopolysaccharide biosynthesis polyprenyl glycosylphosphotransferase
MRLKVAREPVSELELPPLASPRPRTARPDKAWLRAALGTDAAMLVLAFVLAELGSPRAGIASTPLPWQLVFGLLLLALLAGRGMYRPRPFLLALDGLRAMVTTTSLTAMIVLSLRVVVSDDPFVAAQTARIWFFACAYLVGGRAVLFWWELQRRRAGEGASPALVVGAGRIGSLVARRLLDHPEVGLRPVGFLDKEPLDERNTQQRLPVLGASWDLEQVVTEHGVRHVIFAFSTAPQHVFGDLVRRCGALGVRVWVVPRLFERMSGHLGVEYLGGLPLITPQPANPRSWHFTVKYGADRIGAALLLLSVAPILAVVTLAVYISLGRPILFRQLRVGRDGRPFEMLKFRTMRDAEPGAAPVAALPADTAPGGVEGADRRTRVGAFLRQSSLDELPQLWNVIRGEMSLVGPRPERPEYVALFEQDVNRYGERHRVKAGITGWAQVHGLRGNTSLADRVEWDNYYIENWSLWLDVKILLMTFTAVLSGKHA